VKQVVVVKRFKNVSRALLLVSFLAVLLTGSMGCRSSAGTKVNFLRDWEAAKDQAASEGKPIMINFYTDT
jgi:hypothetical protein